VNYEPDHEYELTLLRQHIHTWPLPAMTGCSCYALPRASGPYHALGLRASVARRWSRTYLTPGSPSAC